VDPIVQRLRIELGVLAIGTALFVGWSPFRSTAIHATLAALAGVALISNVPFTRERVWARMPPTGLARERTRAAWFRTALFTVAGLVVLLVARVVSEGDVEVERRWLDGRMVLAVPVYFLWALLQQSLFQFYLLGRLLVLVPRSLAIVLTGLAYGLVHLPDVGVCVATSAAGLVWTVLYFRYRRLGPIALSHAILGVAMYAWVCDRDLFTWWASSWGLG
jgi:membrane protease YdiL (CAAX protease family)